jgi:hypothetical protein
LLASNKSRKVKQEHIEYLCSNETLKSWAGRSLRERAVLMHRRFPDIKISSSTVDSIYRSQGVKKKRVLIKKSLNEKAK